MNTLLYRPNLLPHEIYYAPLIPMAIWLIVKNRGFTCIDSNPGLRYSGLIDDSKSEIYSRFSNSQFTLPSMFLATGEDEKFQKVLSFAEQYGWPIVLKPDRGFRGQAVHVCSKREQIEKYLQWAKFDIQVQLFSELPLECMVYWYFEQGELKIFSSHIKTPSYVVGDGQTTVFDLVREHAKLGMIANKLKKRDPYISWDKIPDFGEKVFVTRIVKRGLCADVTNVTQEVSENLRQWVLEQLDPFDGFNVGRFDLKLGDWSDLKIPTNIKIVELNGASAESGLLGKFSLPLFDEYYTMYKAWDLAFRVGAEIRKREPERNSPLLPFLRDLFQLKDVKRPWQESDWF